MKPLPKSPDLVDLIEERNAIIDRLTAENRALRSKLDELRTLEQELATHKANTERLSFLFRKTKYAKPAQGFHQGAHQITITCPPPNTVPADFLQAIDEAMAREKGQQ